MANILSMAADYFANLVRDTVHLRSLKKSDVETLINNNLKDHQRVVDVLKLMNDAEMKRWMQEKVQPNLSAANSKLKDEYGKYFSELRGKALGEERSCPLGALREANDKYIKILKEIRKNVDHIVEAEAMTIFECRMSHIAVLGLLRQSDRVINYTVYLYTFLVKVASGRIGLIPRYREEYILKYHNEVLKSVNNILNKEANYSFLREVDTIRKRNADLVLGVNGKFGFSNFAIISNYSISFLDNILAALNSLNIFGAAMDAFDDYQISKNARNKEMKEWLENHVSLMRMDLENMDHSSPEYKKTLDIIATYEANITDLDQKINEFEES